MDKIIYESDDVENSNIICKSRDIRNSTNIFHSFNIEGSKDIVTCDGVFNSSQIFGSSFVEDSTKVLSSNNVETSSNVCDSTCIIESKNILRSNNVMGSSEIIGSDVVTESFFCQDCIDIKDCIFCYNLKGAQYHIFNEPVDEGRYKFIKKQYERYRKFELNFVDSWPADLLSVNGPRIFANWSNYFCSIDSKFWQWVKTLPGYDSMLLYTITMNSDFLEI